LAIKLHPDKNPGDKVAEDRFKEASQAYDVLMDPEKRARYDRFGPSAFSPEGAAGYPTSVSEVLEGLLHMFSSKKRHGRDLRYTLELSFEEAAFGVDKTIHFPTRRACAACAGTGGRGGKAGTKACGTCGGKGDLRGPQGIFGPPR